MSSTSLEQSYRVTSLTRNCDPLLGPYSRIMPRALRWPYEGGLFYKRRVTLYEARTDQARDDGVCDNRRGCPPAKFGPNKKDTALT